MIIRTKCNPLRSKYSGCKVINKGTNTLIVKEFMEESVKDNNGVLPGKTIFFCATKAHARRMEEIFDKLYPQYQGGVRHPNGGCRSLFLTFTAAVARALLAHFRRKK